MRPSRGERLLLLTGGFPAVTASPSPSTFTFGAEHGYPPDVFLTQAYAAADGPMFDALSMHPYTWPGLPSTAWPDSGSWAMVPEIRQIMVANGDGAKPLWFTEIGGPSGRHTASWPAAAASAAELVVANPGAAQADLGYFMGAPGLPVNSYVAAVTPGQSWTVMPPTGLSVNQSLAPGSVIPWSITAPPPTSPLSASSLPPTISSDSQQAAIIAQAYRFVAATPWPYVGPIFVYCWSDASVGNNAGPFGLTRLDGTAKPSLAALSATAGSGGLPPGPGIAGYV